MSEVKRQPPGREVDWKPGGSQPGPSKRRIVLGVALLIAVGLVAVLALTGGDEEAGEVSAVAGRWTPMADGPLSPRIAAAGVWTGDELVLWGGRDCPDGRCDDESVPPLADGAAYSGAGDSWRTLASSPLSARSGAAAEWSGTEMLLWGGRDAGGPLVDGAAYDPATDRWRMLAPSPLSARSAQSVWTGTEMVIWGGSVDASGEEVFADGAAYDPATDSWRMLAPAPIQGRFDMVVNWTNDELIVWGGRAGAENLADGAAYDPATDDWRVLAPSPLSPRVARSQWSGDELLIWGGEQGAEALVDGAAYDPVADAWQVLAPSPLTARRGHVMEWTGTELLIWGGGGGTGAFLFGTGAAYDPAADSWRDLPPSPGRFIPVAEWTGQEMLVWGGIVPGDRPATVRATADGVRLTP